MIVDLRPHKQPSGPVLGQIHVKVKATFGFPILVQGQSSIITSPMVAVGVGWDTKKNDRLDLDTSLIQFSDSGQMLEHINYSQRNVRGMTHGGDNTTGEGTGDDELVMVCPTQNLRPFAN